MKILDKQITVESQGVRYIEYSEIREYKVKIEIYSDTYKAQGHCRLEVLDKERMKWTKVVVIPAEAMKTNKGLYVHPAKKTRDFTPDFAADREWLLTVFGHLTE